MRQPGRRMPMARRRRRRREPEGIRRRSGEILEAIKKGRIAGRQDEVVGQNAEGERNGKGDTTVDPIGQDDVERASGHVRLLRQRRALKRS